MRPLFRTLPVAALMALAACNADSTGGEKTSTDVEQTVDSDTGADSMASNDPAQGQQADIRIPDSQDRPTMQLQVVLDRQGFTPGVVDGKMGMSTKNAIMGFQEANDMEPTGKLDEATKSALARWENIPATRVVTIPASFAQASFEPIPDSPAKKAEMERLGYTSLEEKLAERFHTTVETLKMLNPGGKPAGMTEAAASASPSGKATMAARATPSPSPSRSPTPTPTASASGSASGAPSPDTGASPGGASFFKAGQQIRVPNIGADKIAAGSVDDEGWQQTLRSLGVGTDQPKVDRILVSEEEGTLKAFDQSGKLVALYTATMGSEHDPLPIGDWKILGVAHNPPFAYNPELFWDVPDDQEKQMLPPGPNGPVGVVWIDLSKEHYGIHGTPEPETIGRVQSHGCIRLTNWDAARLAQMVHSGTKAEFRKE